MAGLEQLRDLYDRKHLGLVLMGMPGLEKRMARYAQLYSRIGFVHLVRPLATTELQRVIEHKWSHLGIPFRPTEAADAEAFAAIVRTTSGNFRLLERLFTQIERLLAINDLRVLTTAVVDAARESLVIGEQ
jgi:DNA transposition AAA+ family ATPase